MITPSTRTPADVDLLMANGAVPPNITEWATLEDRGIGVSVDTKTNMIKAKLYFGLKGDPSFKFEGNITVDARTGAASMEISRIPA